MFRSPRTLLWVGVTVATVAVASVAHAAVGTRPVPAGVSSRATTTTTTATAVRAKPTVKTTAKTTATTVVKTTATTSAKVPAAATGQPATFRVQAGAARTRAGAGKLAKVVVVADPTGGYVVTGSGTTWRVVSACRSATAAAAIKAALAQHGIAAFVYKSKRC